MERSLMNERQISAYIPVVSTVGIILKLLGAHHDDRHPTQVPKLAPMLIRADGACAEYIG